MRFPNAPPDADRRSCIVVRSRTRAAHHLPRAIRRQPYQSRTPDGYSAAPNSSHCRSAVSTSAVVAARKPHRRRPPRSRTARDRGRALARDVQASFRAAIAVPARPHLPFGYTGTFLAGDAPDRDRESLSTSHDVPQRHGLVLRRTGASKGSRPYLVSPSMSARASTSAPQPGHTAGSGSRTSMANCARQSRHPPPPSRAAPETPPADAPPATAARSTLLHRQAYGLVRARRRTPDSRGRRRPPAPSGPPRIGAMTSHPNR